MAISIPFSRLGSDLPNLPNLLLPFLPPKRDLAIQKLEVRSRMRATIRSTFKKAYK